MHTEVSGQRALPARELSFDLVRTFIILTVVMYHHPAHGQSGPNDYWFSLTSQIIPTALFVSGLTAKLKPPGQTFRDRFRTLILPLAVATLLVAPLWAVLSGNPLSYLIAQVPRFLYGSGGTLLFYAAWFLPLLVLVATITAAAYPPLKRAIPDPRWHLAGALVLLYGSHELIAFTGTLAVPPLLTEVLGFRRGFHETFARLGFPWSIDIVPFGLALYWAGIASRDLRDPRLPPPGWIAAGLLAASFAIFLLFPVRFDPNVHMTGNFPLTAAGLMLKVAALTAGSAWLAEYGPRKILYPLARCGRYSLLILLFHTTFLKLGSIGHRLTGEAMPEPVYNSVLWVLAVVLPMLLNDHVFSRFPRLDRIFGGLTQRCEYAPPLREQGARETGAGRSPAA